MDREAWHALVHGGHKELNMTDKAEVDVFWNSLAFSMIQWMLTIWSLVFCLC